MIALGERGGRHTECLAFAFPLGTNPFLLVSAVANASQQTILFLHVVLMAERREAFPFTLQF